jgi:hypothetical protein
MIQMEGMLLHIHIFTILGSLLISHLLIRVMEEDDLFNIVAIGAGLLLSWCIAVILFILMF